MPLKGIPQKSFAVQVNEYQPSRKMPRCPRSTPPWVQNLTANGTRMNLESIVIQAGRHFSDSLHMEVFSGSATRRQEATKLAWILISMLGPRVVDDRLVVEALTDPDVRRFATEIIGVGVSLELLRQEGIIDARTVRKQSHRFDFEANGCNGAGKILIEAKGTTKLASIDKHRTSFCGKLNSLGLFKRGSNRGYSRAIGIVFSTWTSAEDRKYDIELLDPEWTPEPKFEEAIRKIIQYYSRRLDETAGLMEGAKLLWTLSESERLFNPDSSLHDVFGHPRHEGKFLSPFRRSKFTFKVGDIKTTYWGSFWDGGAVPCPLDLDARLKNEIRYAYTGIDKNIFNFIRDRKFEELLNYHLRDQLLQVNSEDGLKAFFVTSSDGVIQGWMNKIPEDLEYSATHVAAT
ncbi:hypothetical protein METEAL_07390 [Mesoterricola silvestris]|uniref:Uncharacterized protein n=2 Tax=Mesoterricola silvestris TaxID=2927979 RepID=A0AA48GP39_9BACT|nr:hypothetical protein METEAL_07390 [Mesoterricola silvestris]